jgi:hypothetical protein
MNGPLSTVEQNRASMGREQQKVWGGGIGNIKQDSFMKIADFWEAAMEWTMTVHLPQ